MTALFDGNPPPTSAALRAAALLARDGRFTVRVVVRSGPDTAILAAAEAGVDLAIERSGDGLLALFAPRHEDRRGGAIAVQALCRLGPVRAGSPDAPAAPLLSKPALP